MEKVIITGADGFIGVHLTQKLIENGIEVWAVVYPESQTKERIKGLREVHYIEQELSDLQLFENKFPTDADAFYHLAWQGVNANDRDNLELQMKNIELCLEMLKFASKLRAKKFILPGSTSEYLYYGKPINENAVPSPQNAYGTVKIVLRYLAQQYAKQYNISFIYVVITGIYAADRRDNNVIFYVIQQLLKQEKPALTKLEQLWDYVNIKDVIRALELVGEKGRANAFYAIGHGDNWPLYKYIEIIHKYIDQKLPIGIGEIPYASEKMPSSCIDLSSIYEDTGFVPEVDFEQGIKEVIDYMRRETD